ncbi:MULTISPECIES: hypothetical protein [unclassified Streptomyces]|uniref:hypothetical protein n=1 Tax=unclassified Streptomyces TaxID=2593676 RepID=UPI002366796D|nr:MULTISPECIES: hypothetical protein [unclassified Streptomyces]MDF3141425.1 hypothetical protein [Streptomyces sp. T21Q-yed]WDF35312.1 hypothetical protein PBV52_00055 [Streptomyces sp. T12]WDF44476.1 hypothetical protein PBV52_50745 [Streptomyces sp. T12]
MRSALGARRIGFLDELDEGGEVLPGPVGAGARQRVGEPFGVERAHEGPGQSAGHRVRRVAAAQERWGESEEECPGLEDLLGLDGEVARYLCGEVGDQLLEHGTSEVACCAGQGVEEFIDGLDACGRFGGQCVEGAGIVGVADVFDERLSAGLRDPFHGMGGGVDVRPSPFGDQPGECVCVRVGQQLLGEGPLVAGQRVDQVADGPPRFPG